jgi:hypothetical protein
MSSDDDIAYFPQTPDNPICAHTFLNEKRLGHKLSACSKCKGTYYKDRDCQIQNWKFHKKVCCAIEKDDPRIREPLGSLQECLDTIEWLLADPPTRVRGRLLLHALKGVKYYMTSPEYAQHSREYDGILGACLLNFPKNLAENMYIIFSIPGFAAYMLSEEVFLTPAMIEKQKRGEQPPIQESYVVGEGDVVQVSPLYDSTMKLPILYCQFITTIISRVPIPTSNVPSPLLIATCRRILQWSASPWVRTSYPACIRRVADQEFVWSPRFKLFHGMLKTALYYIMGQKENPLISPYIEKDEVLPGLTAKMLLETLMVDGSLLLAADQDQLDKLFSWMILSCRDAKKGDAWECLKPQERLELLDLWHDWDIPETIVAHSSSVAPLMNGVIFKAFSSEIILKMWSTIKGSAEPCSPSTVERVEEMHDSLIKRTMPSVKAFIDIFELQYQSAMAKINEKATPFPDDAMDIICEYAFPDIYE